MDRPDEENKIAKFIQMRDEYFNGKDFYTYEAFQAGFEAVEASYNLVQKLVDHIQKTKHHLDYLNELADMQIELKGASEFDRARLVEREKRVNNGSKKGSKVRNKAIDWLSEILINDPSVSAYKLAEMLQNESESNPNLFGKVIPHSTARDYARAAKNSTKGPSTG